MPYRDGVGAARAAIEPELDELRERAEELGKLGRNVPTRLRVEIDELIADVSRPARSMRDVETAEERVRELALALDVAGETAAMTVATRRATWRARLRFASVVAGMLGIVGGAFGAATHDPSAARYCENSVECQYEGLCHANFEEQILSGWTQCVAETDEDCAGVCKSLGTCTAKDGRCVATGNGACGASDLCRSEGACSAGPAGTCVAEADVDCALSAACRESGRCSVDLKAQACVLRRDSDCATLPQCTHDGLCAEWGGRCVTPEEKACRTSDACKDSGQCSPDGADCVAKGDGDCQFSTGCLEHDRCTARSGFCVRH